MADLTGSASHAAAVLLREGDEQLASLRADPAVLVSDQAEAQAVELRRVRGHDPGLEVEPICWAYYPWRRHLVSILGPRAFRTLRLDRNRNKITAEEQERLSRAAIGVVGLSVGHAIAHTLALEGLCGDLRLADFDEIELSNLNRIPATLMDLGMNKAVAAARRIAELDPYLRVTVFTDGIQPDNVNAFFDGLDLVVEECDSLDVKLAVREAARDRAVPLVMETSDRGLIDVERYDLEPQRPPFHGVLGDIQAADLVGLSTHDKVPYVMAIIEPDQLSPRMAASMAEIDYTVSTWPQLGGDVQLGGATVATAVLRILRGDAVGSGRTRLDLGHALDHLEEPSRHPIASAVAGCFMPDPPADPSQAVAYLAGLAPSGGNIQPWRFEVSNDGLVIELVQERTSLMDVRYRGSYVAAGAALHNARVAAAHYGILGPSRILAREGASELAQLDLIPGIDSELAAQYSLVLSRCTNRQAGTGRPLPPATVAALSQAAGEEGVRLRVHSTADDRSALGSLLGESDRIRYLSPDLHQQMMGELRWPGRDPLDTGLDVRTLSLDAADLAKLAVARRRDVMDYLAVWDGGHALGENTRDRVRDSSGVLILTMEGTTPADFVRGGAALQRCWLAAERLGIGLQPISPIFLFAIDDGDIAKLVPIQYREHLAELRDQFRARAGITPKETLIMVLRAVDAPRPEARSRRLSLDEVLHLGGTHGAGEEPVTRGRAQRNR